MTLTKPVQPRALSEEGLGRLRRALFRSFRCSGKIQNFGVRSSCVSLPHRILVSCSSIELRHLFIQQLVALDIVRIIKIHTNNNPADILSKCVSAETLQRHLHNVRLHFQHQQSQHPAASNNSFTACTIHTQRLSNGTLQHGACQHSLVSVFGCEFQHACATWRF